jgi:outer membrane immunogenic protein
MAHRRQNADTVTGFVIGGGYEFKLSPAWSVKAEYQYINLGKNEILAFNGTPISAVTSVPWANHVRFDDDAFHTIRAGLNYHPGAVYQPLK